MSDNNTNNAKAGGANKPSAKKNTNKNSNKVAAKKAATEKAVTHEVSAVEEVSVIVDIPAAEEIATAIESAKQSNVIEEITDVQATVDEISQADEVVEEKASSAVNVPTAEVIVTEKVVEAPKAAPVVNEPAWDVDTWIALANLKLGISSYAMAAALHNQPSDAMLTESRVKKLLTSVLGTKIN